MPLYEYQCQKCGNRSEVIQRMSDPPLATCEDCGGDLKKLLSAPAFQFKGTGWYVTDYPNSKEAKRKNESGGSDSDSSSASDSGKSEDSGGSESKSGADSSSSDGSSSNSGSSSKVSQSTGKTKSERIASD